MESDKEIAKDIIKAIEDAVFVEEGVAESLIGAEEREKESNGWGWRSFGIDIRFPTKIIASPHLYKRYPPLKLIHNRDWEK